ncbi:pyridoxine 5'-phosphate synthase [Idiomarina zobellii]|uniref:Pyridoxine 5'-phosphate synthase n=1 Tax=Idiomarina zobellii TaxID=86103 RepID=A0A837NI22_9GAMM|nr:pyridoxine 5'-phosphate synthase [Idiomarina zobellii]KPD24427.1 pyridoxine 5'-phosphate synthase [Idiomarina zobellii]SDF45428.1 pyridoxine 5'-phosphate synthase [Idiomarina zobellii]
MRELRLGVNIDHVATLRNARGVRYPDPVAAASIAERAGADGITIHLREDRRHITDRDVAMLKQTLNVPMNLEMAVTDEMIDIAVKTRPTFSCLVPEKREELTTEGGLDVAGQVENIANATKRLTDAGIQVSLFIDADHKQIDAAKEAGAPIIELHTGQYAEADTEEEQKKELARLMEAAEYAHSIGLQVNAGHGLHYHNTLDVAQIPQMVELNIGHSIIARAVLDGLDKAVRDMREILDKAR